jgi:hypothetical protein
MSTPIPSDTPNRLTPIHISYDWALSELLTAQRYYARSRCRWPFRWAGHALACLFVLIGVLSLATSGPRVLSGVLIFGGLYWLFLRAWLHRRVVTRRHASSSTRDRHVTWEIAEDKLLSETEGISKAELTWAMFVKVIETPEGWMMFQNKMLFHWIPRSGLANEADIARMKELVRKKVDTVVTVK